MKLSTIYRKAAKLQEDKSYGFPCWAIDAVCGGPILHMWVIEGTPAAKFTKVFFTGSLGSRSGKYTEARCHAHEEGVHPYDYDVIALCFAAAVMEGK